MNDRTAAPPSDVRAALLAAARAELVEHGHADISLRAVARRAGVSHAAPKYYFRDRAALLTAVASQGFAELTAALRRVPATLAALGRAYVAFALANPALFDLMFRPRDLHAADPELRRAEDEAFAVLNAAVAAVEPPADGAPAALGELTVISWALAHGLAVLARDGTLSVEDKIGRGTGAELAYYLVDAFAGRLEPERRTPSAGPPEAARPAEDSAPAT